MQITAKKIDSANATISATIASSIVEENVNKIAKELSKTANISGFRKGKVPVTAVKSQYGEKLVQDAEAQALRDVLDGGLKELGFANDKLIGEPQVTKFDKKDDSIEVEVIVALRPEIELGDYNSLVPDFNKPKVTKKAVEDRIKELASAQTELNEVEEDRALENDDFAKFDFEGSIDGKLFDGGAAKDFSLQIGSGQFIPGFEDQMLGLKKGEEKVIKVTFPQEYGSADLAGKDAEFKVTLNAIEAKAKVIMNDKLAKKMMPNEEDATIDMLKGQVEEQIQSEELAKLYNEDLKPKVLDKLVETFNFDLPSFVVEQEIDMALNKKAGTMSEEEVNELKENQDKVTELRETFREDATRSVKATFIIDALAAKESIKVDEQEVMQTIYFEAMQTGQDPSAAYENYKKAGYIPAIQMAMVEDKVLSKMLDAKIA